MTVPYIAPQRRADLEGDGWIFIQVTYRNGPALLAIHLSPDPDMKPGYWFYYKGGKLVAEPLNHDPVPVILLENVMDAVRGSGGA
jgi:hypothetical protein